MGRPRTKPNADMLAAVDHARRDDSKGHRSYARHREFIMYQEPHYFVETYDEGVARLESLAYDGVKV